MCLTQKAGIIILEHNNCDRKQQLSSLSRAEEALEFHLTGVNWALSAIHSWEGLLWGFTGATIECCVFNAARTWSVLSSTFSKEACSVWINSLPGHYFHCGISVTWYATPGNEPGESWSRDVVENETLTRTHLGFQQSICTSCWGVSEKKRHFGCHWEVVIYTTNFPT